MSSEDKNGKRKLIAKDKIVNRLFDLNDIDVEEYVNAKTGKTVSRYSGVYVKDDYYKIAKPYSELKDLVINKTYSVKGYMGHSTNYKNK